MVAIISDLIKKWSKTKEDTKMVNKHIKRCPTSCAIGKNAKTRQSIIHSLEWPKFKTSTALNAVEDVKQWKLSFIPGGKAK